MNKENTKKKIKNLIKRKKEIENAMRKTMVEYMEEKSGDHISTLSIPYKKWIREELGLVI